MRRALLLIAVSIMSTVTMATRVTPVRGDDPVAVRFDSGRIDVMVQAVPESWQLTANVRVSFRMHNTSKQTDAVRRVVRVLAPPVWGRGKNWYKVSVNGEPVETTAEPLLEYSSLWPFLPIAESEESWQQRLDQWIAQDAELLKLITRYRKLQKEREKLGEVTREFGELVTRHLLPSDALESTAVSVAAGDASFSQIVRLMPVVDPTLQVDGHSILYEYHQGIYRPYEQGWRRQVDEWFAGQPEVARLLPRLREARQTSRDATALLDGAILKHLHDVNGLAPTTAEELKSFIGHSFGSPPAEVMRSLFPDIRAELDKQKIAATQRLAEYGFEEFTISPFTGKRLSTHGGPRGFRFAESWRDSTVWATLGRRPPETMSWNNPVLLSVPTLVSFAAPLPADESALVMLEYDLSLTTWGHSRGAGGFGGAFLEASGLVVPFRGEADVVVTCPTELQPAMRPAPHAIKVLSGKRRQFAIRLTKDATMLHMILVGFRNHGPTWVDQFDGYGPHATADLQVVLEATKNPTIRPLLMSALYELWLEVHPVAAHELSLRIAREHPDFLPNLQWIQSITWGTERSEEMADWVAAKGKSPALTTDEDFERFDDPRRKDDALPPSAVRELARRVALLKDNKLAPAAQIARRFILCQAGIDTKTHLAEFLRLATAHPSAAIESLRLIELLSIEDKSDALPFVLAQCDLNLRAKAKAGKVTTTEFLWLRQNAASAALQTFRSPATAPQLIRLIRESNEESLLVQSAVSSLSHMTLPGQWEELAGIADKVADASESAFIQYLDLLIRSSNNRDQVVTLLESYRQKYPRLAHTATRALLQVGSDKELVRALAAYANSTDLRTELPAAIECIQKLATVKDLAKLTYRPGLPKWMNERLLDLIRKQGGDASVFPFVAAFYQEHVRGKRSHNHATCVGALEQTGDARAIPMLREILQTTERKSDAATAIGTLQLRRALPRPRHDNPYAVALKKVREPDESAEVRKAAWEILLANPEAALARALHPYFLDRMPTSRFALTADNRERFAFLARFGDAAAKKLLQRSEGCSLHERYLLADLLGLLLPGSRELIENNATNKALDADRQATARLALKRRQNP